MLFSPNILPDVDGRELVEYHVIKVTRCRLEDKETFHFASSGVIRDTEDILE